MRTERLKPDPAASLLGLIFVVAYTLTLLPFGVEFFRNLAGPVKLSILGLRTSTIHAISIPFLLICMDFISFYVACSLWSSLRTRRGIWVSSLAVFLICQGYPVASVYLDLRTADYESFLESARKAHIAEVHRSAEEHTIGENMLRLRTVDINRTARLRAQLDAEITRDWRRLQHLQATRGTKEGTEIIAERAELLRTIQAEERSKAEYDKQLIRLGNRTKIMQPASRLPSKTGTQTPTFFGFIGSTFKSGRNWLSLFLALLFPVGMLGCAYVVASDRQGVGQGGQAFNLAHELRQGSMLPKSEQSWFAQLLRPAITAHVVATRAGKAMMRENVVLEMETQGEFDLLGEASSLRAQVAKSNLSPEAKTLLDQHIQDLNHHNNGKEARP